MLSEKRPQGQEEGRATSPTSQPGGTPLGERRRDLSDEELQLLALKPAAPVRLRELVDRQVIAELAEGARVCPTKVLGFVARLPGIARGLGIERVLARST